MPRFVSFKTATEPPDYVVVNPDHVVLVEPHGKVDPVRCRIWFSVPVGGIDVPLYHRDVLGNLKDVGLRLQDPPSQPLPSGDPLGTHRK